MTNNQNYKDLKVWQESIVLVKETYLITKMLPKDEIYGITSQIRRAVVSIPSNIAEGQRRHSHKEFIHFLNIAIGSAGELETQLIIVKEIYSLSIDLIISKLDLVTNMMLALRKSIESKLST